MAIENITFTVDAHVIEHAQERAVADHTTLNEQFRLRLEAYVGKHDEPSSFDATIDEPQEN